MKFNQMRRYEQCFPVCFNEMLASNKYTLLDKKKESTRGCQQKINLILKSLSTDNLHKFVHKSPIHTLINR
jgi:hypothetical protein